MKNWLILASFIGTSLNALAQEIPQATWWCGPYSQDAAPADLGSVVSYSEHTSSQNQVGSSDGDGSADLVFSQKGFTYDDNGNVVGTETLVRPSAQALGHALQILTDASYGAKRAVGGATAGVSYDGRIIANAGAPAGAAIPLNIRIRGSASAFNSSSAGAQSSALAWSGFVSEGGSLFGTAQVDANQTSVEYDKSLSATVSVTSAFECWVRADANAVTDQSTVGSSVGTAAAFADPSIEIDPSYPYKEFFSLAFSTNILFTPPNPLAVALLPFTNGSLTIQVTCPASHIYEIQATTNLMSTNWQAIAIVTNTTGTVDYTDSSAGAVALQFYRARVVKKLQ